MRSKKIDELSCIEKEDRCLEPSLAVIVVRSYHVIHE
jgi:hypothetical protein